MPGQRGAEGVRARSCRPGLFNIIMGIRENKRAPQGCRLRAKADGDAEDPRLWSSWQVPTSTAGIKWAVSSQRRDTDQYTHQIQALACLYLSSGFPLSLEASPGFQDLEKTHSLAKTPLHAPRMSSPNSSKSPGFLRQCPRESRLWS